MDGFSRILNWPGTHGCGKSIEHVRSFYFSPGDTTDCLYIYIYVKVEEGHHVYIYYMVYYNIYIYIYVYIYIYIKYVCNYACVYVYILYIYVCVCVRVYIYIYIYIYTYIYIYIYMDPAHIEYRIEILASQGHPHNWTWKHLLRIQLTSKNLYLEYRWAI